MRARRTRNSEADHAPHGPRDKVRKSTPGRRIRFSRSTGEVPLADFTPVVHHDRVATSYTLSANRLAEEAL